MHRLWGGRFEATPDALLERLNNSLPFDQRLWRYDVQGSIAHATMLGESGILSMEEASQIVEGLQAIANDLDAGRLAFPSDAEDVHTAIEGLLYQRIGSVAGKLHTARSRNDQVATDLRLYLREVCDGLKEELRAFQEVLVKRAEQHVETLLPGYTHLQHAQPVSLAHHLLAYFWMLDRDKERFSACRSRINRLPLGAGALAGTGFPIDRQRVAKLLGFEEVLPNSLDAVSDRDFVVEFLSAAAILMMHLSRLSEEVILWSSWEFGFVTLDDRVTTGSSIMPQKKNPDVAELARGKTGRVYGDLLALLTTLKGLPLAYNKDLQEDKEPLFDAIDTLFLVLPALKLTLETAQFYPPRMQAALQNDFSTATDLADYLARKGMPFREAHEVVGRIVRYCMEKGIGLEGLDEATLRSFSPLFGADAHALLSPEKSAASRTSEGGTAPSAVRTQLLLALQRLQDT